MKKMTVLDLCICAMMIAVHILMEWLASLLNLSIPFLGMYLKINISTLAFVLAGILCGPLEGLITGLLGTFVSQMLTYGLMITTPIWMIPGAVQGLLAGLVYNKFSRAAAFRPVIITNAVSMAALVILNWVASCLDGYVIFKYMTMEALIAVIIPRVIVGILLAVVYSIISWPVRRALNGKCPGDMKKYRKNLRN